MTSKTIPPEDERVSDDEIVFRLRARHAAWLRETGCASTVESTFSWAADVIERLRSTQPDREAIIEGDEAQAYWLRRHARVVREMGPSGSPGALASAMERRADSLKHSDTTSNGGKNG